MSLNCGSRKYIYLTVSCILSGFRRLSNAYKFNIFVYLFICQDSDDSDEDSRKSADLEEKKLRERALQSMKRVKHASPLSSN